jgi:hypothetical protein
MNNIKQLNADTALLFQISVVALGVTIYQQKRTRCRLVAASLVAFFNTGLIKF